VIPPGLLTLFSQTVTVYRSTGQNSRGDRLYRATAETYKARQENKITLVKDRLGQDVVSKTRCFVAATSTGFPAVHVDDKVVMPDGTMPKLIAVDALRDDVGPNHMVLYA
jgi:hypothetical protein